MRYLSRTHLLIYAGLTLGLLASAFVIDTDPAVLGWVFGAGIGLSGGAFLAAVTSGETLVSGPDRRGKPNAAPWLEPDDESPPVTSQNGSHE